MLNQIKRIDCQFIKMTCVPKAFKKYCGTGKRTELYFIVYYVYVPLKWFKRKVEVSI